MRGLARCDADEPVYEALTKQIIDKLVREYQTCARDNPKMAVATVAIKTLTSLITQSQATTMMGLEKEVKEAAAALQRHDTLSCCLVFSAIIRYFVLPAQMPMTLLTWCHLPLKKPIVQGEEI